MKNDLEHAIGYFEATYVDKFDIDLFNNKITLQIKTYENEKPKNHEITFQKISAFYFSNGPGENRFNVHTLELIEISGIGYHKRPKDHITCINDTPNTSQYNSNPNFNLEIWSALFLIEAQEVIIDGVIYQTR